MYDEKPETAFGASVVKFKSMTVRQKFGPNGNEALHAHSVRLSGPPWSPPPIKSHRSDGLGGALRYVDNMCDRIQLCPLI